MSAPIQNVYFYDPDSITTLQAQVAALQTNVGYGLDDNSLIMGGVTGNQWYVDLFTGNYGLYATNEIGVSSGANTLSGGSLTQSTPLMSDIIVQIIKD